MVWGGGAGKLDAHGKKTPLNVCPLKYTYIGKNHFNLISVWSEIISLKSDRLELGFSILMNEECVCFILQITI